MVGGVGGADEATVMANAGSDADPYALLTLITMPEEVPTFAAAGVPLNCPVAALNAAQEGLPEIRKVRVPPEGFATLGWNEYRLPVTALVAGVPEMIGAVPAAVTVMAKAGNDAAAGPSLTLMTI